MAVTMKVKAIEGVGDKDCSEWGHNIDSVITKPTPFSSKLTCLLDCA